MGGVNASQALNHHLVPLAQELNQDKVTPGLLGFVIFACIAGGLWWLMRNMGKQMSKINFTEEPKRPPAAPEHDGEPSSEPRPGGQR